MNYGKFLDAIVSFLFTTLFLFIIYKSLLKLKKAVEVDKKKRESEARKSTAA